MKEKMNGWFFGLKGLMPEYEKGERPVFAFWAVVALGGLGSALYLAILAFVRGTLEVENVLLALLAGVIGGMGALSIQLKAVTRELRKRREG